MTTFYEIIMDDRIRPISPEEIFFKYKNAVLRPKNDSFKLLPYLIPDGYQGPTRRNRKKKRHPEKVPFLNSTN